MKKLDELKKKEEAAGKAIAEAHQFTMELTGVDPRGQLGVNEIYEIAYRAAQDAMKESKSLIYTGPEN